MSIFLQRHGIVGLDAAARSIMTDLLANGFTEVANQTIADTTANAAFQAGLTVDPLSASQPWRIRIATTGGLTGKIDINIATPLQIKNDGSVVSYDSATTAGLLYRTTAAESWATGSTFFPSGSTLESNPLSYVLSVSPRGIACCLWVEGQDNSGKKFSWFVVQRPVDNTTGAVLNTGKCPVFVAYSTRSGNAATDFNYADASLELDTYKFVVRESDVNVPTVRKSAVVATEDSAPIINPLQQVSIVEGNEYVVTFLNNLNTQRHFYKHELDMIGYLSADVISTGTDAPVTVYGESQARTYMALPANGVNNTGMRVVILKSGGGIS